MFFIDLDVKIYELKWEHISGSGDLSVYILVPQDDTRIINFISMKPQAS